MSNKELELKMNELEALVNAQQEAIINAYDAIGKLQECNQKQLNINQMMLENYFN